MHPKITKVQVGTYNSIVYSFPVFFNYICDTISFNNGHFYWCFYMY